MFAKDQALALLSQGLKQSVVASALGVEESYVSQLLTDEDFAAELAQKKKELSVADVAYDTKLDRATEDALDRIETKLPFANLQQTLQAFKVLDGAKRRKERGTPGAENAGVTVNILLPTVIAPRYLQNQSGEIVEVEGQTMLSATPKNLEELVQKRKQLKLDSASSESRVAEVSHLKQKLEVEGTQRASEFLTTVAPVRKNVRKIGLLSVDSL